MTSMGNFRRGYCGFKIHTICDLYALVSSVELLGNYHVVLLEGTETMWLFESQLMSVNIILPAG